VEAGLKTIVSGACALGAKDECEANLWVLVERDNVYVSYEGAHADNDYDEDEEPGQ